MTALSSNGGHSLLMLSGDRNVGQGREGAFYYTLSGFRHYWRRIDVLCPAAPGASPRQPFENVFVHPAMGGRAQQPLFIQRVGRRLLRERSYGLLVSHDFGLFYNALGAQLLLWTLPAGGRPPLVSEIHHLPGYPRASGPDELVGLLLHQLYVRGVWPRLAALRVVNGAVAAQLLRWGVPAPRVLVLSSFYLDHKTFRPLALPKEWDLLFCARLVPNKAPMLLLEAIARIARSLPRLRCAVVGEGPFRAAMQRRIARLGIEQNVVFLGWLPSARDLAELYNRSRLLICTSYNEGGPRVALEAMACGIPVVSTPVGIMPDVIGHRETGLLADWQPADLADKMADLLADQALAERVGAAGRAAVQRFNYEDELRRYAEAYLRLAEGSRPEAATTNFSHRREH